MEGRKKLSKLEQAKISLPPGKFLERIKMLDPSSMDEMDRFYLKNFGIYSTRLRPDSFMVRIRIPGGRMSGVQARHIGDIAQEYHARILLTARSQIELHDLSYDEAVSIFDRLPGIGLTSIATLGDNIRNIVTDPYDGCEGIECYPIIRDLDILATDLDGAGMLPRKFNTAITGCRKWVSSYFTNDLLFALATKDGVAGFNVFWGGKNSHFAQDANIFVEPHEVEALFGAVIWAYRHYGLRHSRTRARLWHLLQEKGMQKFRQMVKERFGDFETKGELELDGVVPRTLEQCSDRWLVKRPTYFGRLESADLQSLYIYPQVRLGVDQNLYLPSTSPPSTLEAAPTIVVCAGSCYCVYSLFDTKDEAKMLPLDRLARLGVAMGYSGCLKGCGRHVAADIGLVGIRTNAYGAVERGVRLYMGGLYSRGERPARMIFWAVPLRKLSQLLETILDLFERSPYKSFEDFSRWLWNFEKDIVAIWILEWMGGAKMEIEDVSSDPSRLQELERLLFGL